VPQRQNLRDNNDLSEAEEGHTRPVPELRFTFGRYFTAATVAEDVPMSARV